MNCKICKKLLKSGSGQDYVGKRLCKKCYSRIYQRKQWKENPSYKIKDKIYKFLYGHLPTRIFNKNRGTSSPDGFVPGLLTGDGCCLICSEFDPFTFENHHLFGRNNPFQITLCGRCHTILNRYGWEYLLWKDNQ